MKKISKGVIVLLGCLICFSVIAHALTADEYFEIASSKYLQGNNQGALVELNRALALNSQHKGAQELKEAIQAELGLIQPAPTIPPPTIAPTTIAIKAPPTTIKPSPKPKPITKTKQAEPKQPNFTIVKITTPSVIGLEKFDQAYKLLAYVFGFILFALLLVLLSALFYRWFHLHDAYCSECKTSNSKDAEFCKKCGMRLRAPEFHAEQQLWLDKFGWRKNPFTLSVMPETYAGNQAEIAKIIEKLNTLSGHVMIIGGLGTGKTTLLQWLEKNLKYKFETIYLLRPPTRPEELVDFITATLLKKTKHTHKYSIFEFRKLCGAYKKNILILIDEAHEINEPVEQFIRTLGDLHNVFLVIAGLPQTREMIKRELPAFFDRIVESVLLTSLSREEVGELIKKRIAKVGGNGYGPFTTAAVDKIYDLGLGIPRAILKICDWLVAHAVKKNKATIDEPEVMAYNEEIRHLKLLDAVKDKAYEEKKGESESKKNV